MSISNTYRKLLTDQYIQAQLEAGRFPTASELTAEIQEMIDSMNLTVPQFDPSLYSIERNEESSASKSQSGFEAVKQDLTVLYREMARLGEVSTNAYSRWGLETARLEKRLLDLEERIENLLLLTQDTEGYHSVLFDNFTDKLYVEQAETTALVTINPGVVTLGANENGVTRVALDELDIATDVFFKIRTSNDLVNSVDAISSNLSKPFLMNAGSWWRAVLMTTRAPVTAEYSVKLGAEPVLITRIEIKLLDSVQTSPMSITPLYSVDNVNFFQLPSTLFSTLVTSEATFVFPEVGAKYIKFLLTKEGPDDNEAGNYFSFQFGFQQISFFSESYDINTTQELITVPLFVFSVDDEILPFEKLTLEACHRIEEDTDIQYFVTVSNNPLVPLGGALWTPISPWNHGDPQFPVILNVGDVVELEFGQSSPVSVSYDKDGPTGFVNPGDVFTLLSLTGGVVNEDSITALETRYAFKNSNERILDLQIKDISYTGSGDGPLDYVEASLDLFRNVGSQGAAEGDGSTEVREVQSGWGFSDPYYSCVVEILNPEGVQVDFGNNRVIIDGVNYTGAVPNTVLFGKTTVSKGIHKIQIHKDNWEHVTPDLTTLAALKAADPLYPYNHKLLIEGYLYPLAYTEEKIYQGADLFAEALMTRISVFDISNNVPADNYAVYAIDTDVKNSHTGNNEPTQVFVLKVDETNPDFSNELFVVRFRLVNGLQSYLRLKAEFTTDDTTRTPVLDSYKLKLG